MKFTTKLVTFIILAIFVTQPLGVSPQLAFQHPTSPTSESIELDTTRTEPPNLGDYNLDETNFSQDTNVGSHLFDNNNSYTQAWDPWKTKAAIHAVATSDNGDYLALGSGYLYDNQIHLYRWNYQTDQYDLVWEIGGGILQSDVLDLAIADTNHNNLTEIIAAGEDGRLYVFEQRHIYDPITNMENQFDLVWKSERMGRIFSVVVEDTDGDYKKDIIVGTGDTVRWYEYLNHSGYPFSEEHWIEFGEVFSYKMPDYVTALSIADTNQNGLKEIAVGTRSGEIQLLENNGTVLEVNGADYPIMRDNNYDFNWSSGNAIQRQITDMSNGDLDGDGYREIIVAVQGQGAYVLDQIDGIFGTFRLQRDFAKWESDPKGAYPLDPYVDWILNSSSIASVEGSIADFNVSKINYVDDPNVQYYNQSTSTFHPEPLNESTVNEIADIFPYRTATAQKKDGLYTRFNGVNRPAWAVFDWGKHEEAAGNGITTIWDMKIHGYGYTDPSYFTVSISQDGKNWTEIPSTDIIGYSVSGLDDYYEVEVDNVLNNLGWNYYRYMKVNVSGAYLRIDSFETRYFNKPITDAQSTAVGKLTFKGQSTPTDVGYVGTVDGSILAVAWNDTSRTYDVVWDSWEAERYKLSKNIFDLEIVNQKGTFPAWIDEGSDTFTFDTNVPAFGTSDVFSYDVENFFNYRNEQNDEFIVVNSTGNIMAFSQQGPKSEPHMDLGLTTFLFNLDVLSLGTSYTSQGIYPTVQSWMNAQSTDYFAASIVSMDTELPDLSSSYQYAGEQSGYFLFLSKWDGKLNATTRSPGDVEVSVWYLLNYPIESASGDCYFIDKCSFFVPVFNNFTETGTLEGKTLSNSELTNQLTGVLGQSTWAPRVNAYDVFDRGKKDLIMANGKLSLLEMADYDEPKFGHGSFNERFGEMKTVLRSGYFDTINEHSKGRIWNNVEPVDLDKDGDMDLILGFARSDETNFQFDKPTYGFTYWENQGTAQDPIWVEQKKAVTNNDPESNFRVNYFADPVLVYKDYNFGDEGFNSTFGYHPVYRTGQPTRMFMFEATNPDTNVLQGKIQQFTASYNQPTSMILATYPEAKRVDLNMQNNADGVNYGFHIFETWDNDDELKEWTLSLDTADLDQDGKNEVIVGDYNNNMYVFEHLTNNTFKRAFKSHDLNRTIETDQSPYAHQQFDGIDGTFYRTVFQHSKYIVAGSDLNNNTLKEVIVATDNMIFVFESVITPGNRIQDDTYILVKMIDIFDQEALYGMPQEELQITALATADDLTLDGRGELLVGVGAGLLVFEVYNDDRALPLIFGTQEVFFSGTGTLKGKYKLPGNYYLYPNYKINSIIVADVDRSGYLDIILSGTDTTNPTPIHDGFITIFEWTGSSYEYTLDDYSIFTNTTLYNPINDIELGDHDYDTNTELYIGHDSGIDIFEFTEPGVIEKRDIITSDPHYQLPTRSYSRMSDVQIDSNTYAGAIGMEDHDKDIIRLVGGRLARVYIAQYYIDSDSGLDDAVVVDYSSDNGVTWGDAELVANSTAYEDSSNFIGFESPSISITWNSIMVGFVGRFRYYFDTFTVDSLGIVVVRKIDGGTWDWNDGANGIDTEIIDYSGKRDISLDLFPTHKASYYDIGVAFINQSKLVMGVLDTHADSSGSDVYRYVYSPLFANGDKNDTDYSIHSFDIAFSDPSNMDFYPYYVSEFDIVFSGYQYNETLSFDYDLYHVPFTMPTTSEFNFTRQPTRTFFSGIRSFNPSVIRERVSNRLVVTFEQPSLREYGGLYAIWSDDENGTSWQGPYDMSHPLGIDPRGINTPSSNLEVIPMASGESYRVGFEDSRIFMNDFNPRFPVLAKGGPGGFTMVYSADMSLKRPATIREGYCGGEYERQTKGLSQFGFGTDQQLSSYNAMRVGVYETCVAQEFSLTLLVSAYNEWSNFTNYTVGGVSELELGDSDQDGREEILAASGKHAFLFEFERNGREFIHHKQEWISPEYFYGVSDVAFDDINNNGFDNLIISSERGTVHAYELVNRQVNTSSFEPKVFTTRNDPVPTTQAEPFIKLGSEFTKRSEFALHDVTGDGWDDIILMDDYFIGVADTERLRNEKGYNEAIWQTSSLSFGRFTGQYAIVDIDGKNGDDIIVVFRNYMLGFDLDTGKTILKISGGDTGDYFGVFRNPTLRIFDYMPSVSGLEIVLSVDPYTGSDYVSSIFIFDSDTNVLHKIIEPKFFGSELEIGDVDNDGVKELIHVTRNTTNVVHSKYTIYEDGNNILQQLSYVGLPPTSDILVGDFRSGFAGDEFILVFDIPLMGNYFGVDYSDFPIIFWILAWDTVNLQIGLPNGFFGISPVRGQLLNGWIADIDNNGYDDFIGQGKTGDLFSFNVSSYSSVFLTDANVFAENLGIPYARDNTILGDFCSATTGTPSFFSTTSATSIGCYDSLDFSTQPQIKLQSANIQIDIIQDLSAGDLDGDGFKDDILIMGREGFVYIFDNDLKTSTVQQELAYQNLQSSTAYGYVENNLPWILPLTAMMVMIPVLIKFRKQIPINL